ncbi:MAG TPA: HAD-IIIC family phosphatase [Candidatus Dormibacteraeota bacterium]|jgi:FkbH-like protein|nr:HAD-IIIC family phosphatase [Candidatus Dormibacteraeota bacterium]
MDASLTEAADLAIAHERWPEALLELRRLYRSAPTLATAQAVLDRGARIPERRITHRLFVARASTLEPVATLLRAASLLHGVDLEIEFGGFSTHAVEFLDPSSRLYRSKPGTVLLALQTRDLVPDLWSRYAELDTAEVRRQVERCLADLAGLVRVFRANSQANLLVQNLEQPARPAEGVLDAQTASSQRAAIEEINRGLLALAAGHRGVYVLDYDGLVARHGRAGWHDERKWLMARMPVAAVHLPALADEYLRHLLPLVGRIAKAVVLDLDGTLWGGVLGEDGIGGIRLDGEYPGAGHLALQRAALALRARGVMLAVASKNDEDHALRALEERPEMPIRTAHLSAFRIGWNDKARSLREIAEELNIGIDSLVFVDDNPAERQLIQMAIPEVTVIDLPKDPTGYAEALLSCPLFERLRLTAEDRERGQMYAEQRERTQAMQTATTLEDYWRSLETVLDMAEPSSDEVDRVAQLTQKTNQFNVTTRRYSAQSIEALGSDPRARVYRVRVRDRFGDNGLVGVAITRDQDDVCEIDTLLLSCRVLGRTVETAILAQLAADARTRGCRTLRGTFLPTERNTPARDLFPTHEFSRVDQLDDGGSLWERDLATDGLSRPEWISIPAVRGESGGE